MYCPLSLVSLCCLAIKRDSIHKHIKLGTLISIPDASIAQKLCEVCIKKSVIIIQKRAIFADGCFVRIIGCGYHLGKKNFLFGHYAGLRQKNITSKLKWFYSIKIQGILHIFVYLQACKLELVNHIVVFLLPIKLIRIHMMLKWYFNSCWIQSFLLLQKV